MNNDITNDDNFKSFKYQAKLIENTVVERPNGIPKNATIAVILKYLSKFWRSLEMPLINCKEELKFRLTKHCVLSAAGNDNANGNDENTIFTIKDTKLYVPVVTLSARDNQKLSKVLNKGFERSVSNGVNIKQKVIIKIQQTNLDIFSNQILLESIDFSLLKCRWCFKKI